MAGPARPVARVADGRRRLAGSRWPRWASGSPRSCPQLLERYSGATVVVVSHVTPIKMILRDALGAGDPFLFRLFLDPAGISTVEYWPDGGIAVRTVNDTAHLA